jgi:galactose mutarotase-like enzyme
MDTNLWQYAADIRGQEAGDIRNPAGERAKALIHRGVDMEIDTLRNEHLQISVKRLGAELTSITDAAGIEYLWQADPRFWTGQSPILFPIVGRLAGDSYSYAGKMYSLPQHGFARRQLFRLYSQSHAHLAYTLTSDASSRGMYPFDYDLIVSYALEGNGFRTAYRVINLDSKPLPFSIGGHPAFSCSWRAGDELEDYYLEFERAEIADTCLVSDGLIDVNKTKMVLANEQILPLTKTRFDNGALIFMNLASSAVTLRSRRHPNTVRVDFPGYPCLGIWSKPAAPFVCIEPWFGHADPAGRSPGSAIETKPGIIFLQPDQSFTCEWRVRITT